jgi:hypothetical protein
MSRSYRYVRPRRNRHWWDTDTPLYVRMNLAAESNPASSYRRKWRREQRNRIKQQIQKCTDWDEISLETRITRLTSVYDWY